MNKVWDPGTLYYRGKQPEGITPPAMSNLWSSEQWPCVMEKTLGEAPSGLLTKTVYVYVQYTSENSLRRWIFLIKKNFVVYNA